MIKEAFVSFETAKLLKEKGFNEYCWKLYELGDLDNPILLNGFELDGDGKFWDNKYLELYKKEHSYINDICSAPTIQMTMRWLREKHLIFFDFRLVLGDTKDGKYMVGVYDMTAFDTYTWKTWVLGDTYEETYEKAIKYVLDNNFFIEDDNDDYEDV